MSQGKTIPEEDLNHILEALKNMHYTLINKLGQGAFAVVYSMEKNHIKYAVRASIIENKEEENIAAKIYDGTTVRECDLLGKCNRKCITSHLVCSNIQTTILGKVPDKKGKPTKYLIQIMKQYDTDLAQFLYEKKTDGFHDIRSYEQLSQTDPKYIHQFNHIAHDIWMGISDLHHKHMAHGDIKPENILINIKDNNITNIAISDLDSICIGKIVDKMIVCPYIPDISTPIFATFELIKVKGDSNVNIDIIKRSDIMAFSVTVLILWFGYVNFLSS